MIPVRFIGEGLPGIPNVVTLGQYYVARRQMVDWLVENIGTESGDTWYADGRDIFRFQGIYFAKEEDAVVFKIRFGV